MGEHKFLRCRCEFCSKCFLLSFEFCRRNQIFTQRPHPSFLLLKLFLCKLKELFTVIVDCPLSGIYRGKTSLCQFNRKILRASFYFAKWLYCIDLFSTVWFPLFYRVLRPTWNPLLPAQMVERADLISFSIILDNQLHTFALLMWCQIFSVFHLALGNWSMLGNESLVSYHHQRHVPRGHTSPCFPRNNHPGYHLQLKTLTRRKTVRGKCKKRNVRTRPCPRSTDKVSYLWKDYNIRQDRCGKKQPCGCLAH